MISHCFVFVYSLGFFLMKKKNKLTETSITKQKLLTKIYDFFQSVELKFQQRYTS